MESRNFAGRKMGFRQHVPAPFFETSMSSEENVRPGAWFFGHIISGKSKIELFKFAVSAKRMRQALAYHPAVFQHVAIIRNRKDHADILLCDYCRQFLF